MFQSFFPRPKVFFLSALAWTAVAMLAWYFIFKPLGPHLSLGGLVGLGYPDPLPEGADDAAKAAFDEASDPALRFWVDQYMLVVAAIFAVAWRFVQPHRWFWWSVVGTQVIFLVAWVQTQLSVMINSWYGSFYDLVQKALGTPNSVTHGEYWGQLLQFILIAMPSITMSVVNLFFLQHYSFRWRTAMNDFYVANWPRLHAIEGASQRVQDDTQRFSQSMEDLGTNLISSVMTLVAFLPVLWGLSKYVKSVPIFGEVPQPLVFAALIWSILGTGLVAAAGIKLPGLNFRNQRVEAAYRKELVLGEDHADRAQPVTLAELFRNVRRNYFVLYGHYLYFNVARYSYLQMGVLVPYVVFEPTVVAGAVTLGIFQRIPDAFSQVASSFQFLVNSWSQIVVLLSIQKRLRAFEATLAEKPLDSIEIEVVRVG
ncbi:MAG: peptide antibiotic transporter SbmA [Bauldia sp.]